MDARNIMRRNPARSTRTFVVTLIGLAVSLNVLAAGFNREVFMGTLGKKTNVDLAIVTFANGEVAGAVYYAPNIYPPFFDRFDDVHRLAGKRRGNTITLVEEREGMPGATIVARIVKTDLRGTWRLPAGKRVSFDFWQAMGKETPLLYERRAFWRPLDRMHDALRAGRLDIAAAHARLACAMNDEGCAWAEAIPYVVMGKEPPSAVLTPWRGFLREVQGRMPEAVAEGREQCERVYPGSHAACRFLADLAPRLPSSEAKTIYELTCRNQQIACDHVFGKAEVELAEAAERSDIAGVARLLEGPVNVNFGSEWRYSPLFCATAAKSLPIVRMLIAHGADPNLKYGYEPPLVFAVDNHEDDIAMFLLDHGAKVEGVAEGALWKAVYAGKHAIAMKMLANGEDPDDCVPAGSPLTAAVDKHDLVIVKALLAHGADPEWEAKHTEGTPIDHARRTHQTKILRLLLAAKERQKADAENR
jgi:hypothetical protein